MITDHSFKVYSSKRFISKEFRTQYFQEIRTITNIVTNVSPKLTHFTPENLIHLSIYTTFVNNNHVNHDPLWHQTRPLNDIKEGFDNRLLTATKGMYLLIST